MNSETVNRKAEVGDQRAAKDRRQITEDRGKQQKFMRKTRASEIRGREKGEKGKTVKRAEEESYVLIAER